MPRYRNRTHPDTCPLCGTGREEYISRGGKKWGSHLHMCRLQKSRSQEERSAIARKGAKALTPEERSDRTRRANASRTPEQRSESLRRRHAATPVEVRRAWGAKVRDAQTPEQHRQRLLRANASRGAAGRSEAARKSNAAQTPAQRSARARRANATQTPEQRSERQRRANQTARRRGTAKYGGKDIAVGVYYAFRLKDGGVMTGITKDEEKRARNYAQGDHKHRAPAAGEFAGFDYVSEEIPWPFKVEQAVLRDFRERDFVVDGEVIDDANVSEVVDVFKRKLWERGI